MRFVVTQKLLRRILYWTQRVLFAGAVSLAAYCGFVLVDAWIFQKSEHSRLERDCPAGSERRHSPRRVLHFSEKFDTGRDRRPDWHAKIFG